MMKTITIKLTDGTTVTTTKTQLASLQRLLRKVAKSNNAHRAGGNPAFTTYSKVMIFEGFDGKIDYSSEQISSFYTTEDMRSNLWKREISGLLELSEF